MARMLTKAQIEAMADDIADFLDENPQLDEVERARWQGALTAFDVVLGRRPRLEDSEGP